LSALTVMLDVTTLVMTGVDGIRADQAKLTFAMARHAAVDLAQVAIAEYSPHDSGRFTVEDWLQLRTKLAEHGVTLVADMDHDGANRNIAEAYESLAELRILYEPYLHALSRRLTLTLPRWIHADPKKDNWQSGPWDRAIQARVLERPRRIVDDHF
jgi:hypothetical protein